MAPRKVICMVCGCSEFETETFHFFPRNSERCQTWLQMLGFKAKAEDVQNARICNRHFSNDAYVPHARDKWTLCKEAVPTPFVDSDKCKNKTKSKNS